jgi:putative ABC transport system permease protein
MYSQSKGTGMFFLTYLQRELRQRFRQAVFIALGLALGVGLVMTATAASSGVKNAQASLLHALYGIGTDMTVTGKPTPPPPPDSSGKPPAGSISIAPGGKSCYYTPAGKCVNPVGHTIDTLSGSDYGTLRYSSVAAIERLHHVTAAAGGLILIESRITIAAATASGNAPATPTTFSVDGVDTSREKLSPLASGTITSGRALAASDASSDAAVVDSGYALANGLKVGSAITIAKTRFKIIGIVSQPQGGNLPAAYIPLGCAQALASDSLGGPHLTGLVNTIYVTADSAADIGAVQKEIHGLLPSATVTSSASLANEVTGSLASAASLANDLGKWLAITLLMAAFLVASLLTLAAVSRRVREFGTLKALGWRSRRVVAQVLGESVAVGVIGGLLGVGLGFVGALLISSIAPSLSATVPQPGILADNGPTMQINGGAVSHPGAGAVHTVPLHFTAPVSVGVIVLAVLLALGGGLIAGSFGGWRAVKLRPSVALAQVE